MMATSSSSVVISTRRSMVSSFLTLGLALFLVLSTLHGASGADWQNLETASLPKGISDHTATRVGDIVYLAGGCDAVDGNKWDEEIKQFLCASISSSFFGFDIVNETLVSPGLPDMPVPRYRHAAAAAGNKIWLVGGRDVDDNPVEQVDVYDIASNTWSTVGDLPNGYNTSDCTGFGWEDRAYFIGGYDENYSALPTVFSIDGTAATGPLSTFTLHTPMNVERGDISSAMDVANGFVLVAGGFTHKNDFCEPHAHAELYNVRTDTWTTVASMEYARADKALVHLAGDNGIFYAIGGERQVSGFCELDVKPEPGERTIPLFEVECFNQTANTWTRVSNLPVHRFRFPAVSEGDKAYGFGGQFGFEQSCDCFKTTPEILVYTNLSSGSMPLARLTLTSLLAVLSGGLMLLAVF